MVLDCARYVSCMRCTYLGTIESVIASCWLLVVVVVVGNRRGTKSASVLRSACGLFYATRLHHAENSFLCAAVEVALKIGHHLRVRNSTYARFGFVELSYPTYC